MIRRLRRRMTLMVIAVLILVSSGIVLAISLANSHSIAAQAEETLAVLTENAGAGENRMQRPDGSMDPRGGRMNRDRRGFRGEPPEIRSGRDAAAAGLNNSYTIFDSRKSCTSDSVVSPHVQIQIFNFHLTFSSLSCKMKLCVFLAP